MTRLELLKHERKAIKCMYLLSFEEKEKALNYYDDEIRTIELGSANMEIDAIDYANFIEMNAK